MNHDLSKEEWCILWNRAKSIESMLPNQKKTAWATLKQKHSELPYKNWSGVSRALEAGKLSSLVAQDAAPMNARFRALEVEASEARRSSELLLTAKRAADKRPILNVEIDPIPIGEYPKLASCIEYPLRNNCNYGENDKAKWDRCRFMHNGGRPGYWMCSAPSASKQ